MIVVTCEACGKSFKAKDELAGRRGKCPGCGEPIVVPEADAGSRPAAPAAPSAPVAARKASPARRASGRRGAGGRAAAARASATDPQGKTTAVGRLRGERRGSKLDLKIVYALLVMIGVTGGVWGYFEFQRSDAQPYPLGLAFMQQAKYDEAIAQFELVPASDPLHPQAQEKLAEAKSLRDAAESRATERLGSNLYNIVTQLERDWVDRGGKGHEFETYAANARYLIKRAQEFLDKYPKDRRAKEVETIIWRYSPEVASLDRPPTELDVWQELQFRDNAHQFRESMEVVDEFAAANPDATELVQEMRDKVQSSADEYWKNIRDGLEEDRSLAEGAENWQRVVNQCRRYLDAVEGVPGLTVDRSAQDLHDRAQLGG